MKAIIVSVDYADLLAFTLAYNRHHFNDVLIISSTKDHATANIAQVNDADLFTTDSFYADGAIFNKWRALEEGLDAYGREGWTCLMDADVLWPKHVDKKNFFEGILYTPRRRMMYDVTQTIPPESEWNKFALHPQEVEWAGYTQIFHGNDAHLGKPPWHETNWRHAGGADSFFQAKWPQARKVRPDFEVLHLGEAGENWCGRSTPYLDGSRHPAANERLARTRAFIRGRKGDGPSRFDGERILPR